MLILVLFSISLFLGTKSTEWSRLAGTSGVILSKPSSRATCSWVPRTRSTGCRDAGRYTKMLGDTPSPRGLIYAHKYSFVCLTHLFFLCAISGDIYLSALWTNMIWTPALCLLSGPFSSAGLRAWLQTISPRHETRNISSHAWLWVPPENRSVVGSAHAAPRPPFGSPPRTKPAPSTPLMCTSIFSEQISAKLGMG